jgi:hypothetical protein
VSGRLLAEDGAHFTATIKRTEDGPQARYRVVFDAGEKASSGDCTPTPHCPHGIKQSKARSGLGLSVKCK